MKSIELLPTAIDQTGVIVSSVTEEGRSASAIQCTTAFFELYCSMSGVRVGSIVHFLDKSMIDCGMILRCLQPGSCFKINSPDRNVGITFSLIRGHSEALTLSVASRDPGQTLSLFIAILDNHRLYMAGRESSVRNLLQATRWHRKENKDVTWGTGEEIENWVTNEGLEMLMDPVRTESYSEVIQRPHSFLAFPWSRAR